MRDEPCEDHSDAQLCGVQHVGCAPLDPEISLTTASSAVKETSYQPCDGLAALTLSLADQAYLRR